MRYIGDVHGKWARYKNILKTCEESIQIGDMDIDNNNNILKYKG